MANPAISRWFDQMAQLPRRALIGLLVLVALILASQLVNFQTQTEMARLGSLQQRSRELVHEARGIRLSLLDMETAVRGFLLTGLEPFLDPFKQGRTDITKHLRLSLTLADDNDDALLADIDRRTTLWLEFALPLVERRRALRGDDAGVLAIIHTLQQGIGKRHMDNMRQLMSRVETRALASEQGYAAQASALQLRAYYILLSTSLLQISLLTTLSLLLARNFMRMQRNSVSLRTEMAQHEKAETRARESEVRVAAILDNAVDAIITTNEKGIIVDCNHATEGIFGWLPDELLGRSGSSLLPERNRTEFEKRMSELRSATDSTMQLSVVATGLRKDGSEFPMELSYGGYTLQGQRMFTSIVRDVSERREIERAKNEFVSTVSHELRTPLTAIMGSLGIVSSGMAGDLPAEAAGMVKIAARNSEHLAALINDILDLEKMESGCLSVTPVPVALGDFLGETIKLNRGFADHYGVRLELASPPPARVLADPVRLAQVLANLLSNAIKFSPPAGTVTLAARIDEARIRISVSDQGSGIPEAFRSRIFGKFSQADGSTTRQAGGTGLGLAIAKSLVERMHGELGFESSAGAGTTFHILLPRA